LRPDGVIRPRAKRAAGSAATIRATLRGTTLTFLVAGLLLLPAVLASAQTPEVQVDPNSPAGAEYAIPLDKARRDAGGGGKGSQGKRGGESDQLFGAGIEKQPEEPAPPPTPETTEAPEPVPAEPAEENKPDRPKKKRSKEAKGDSKPSAAATSRERDDTAAQKTAAAVEATSDDSSPGLVMGGIAVGVLGLGLLVGVGLRRLFRST
jgi:outer membrane biosynthesis protein TonB